MSTEPIQKRVRDVENVLQWAFRHELPKRKRDGKGGEPCAVSPMFRMANLGVRVDNWNREPGFPAFMGEPHPDALKVEAAVANLVRLRTVPIVEADLELAPDFAALGVDETTAMARAFSMVEAIVVHHAKAADRPFWTKRPDFFGARESNGRPTVLRWELRYGSTLTGDEVAHEVLVPVAAERRETYPEGAYCPLKFEPAPQAILDGRAEYLAWWTALNALAEDLRDLDTFAVLPPGAAQKPWFGEPELPPPPRIFADLTARTYQREARETAAAHRMLGLRRTAVPRKGEPALPLARRRHVAELVGAIRKGTKRVD